MVRPPSGRVGTKQQKEQRSGQVEGDGGDDAEGVAARRRPRRWASLSAPARTLPIPSRSAQSGVRIRQQCSQPRPIPAQPHPFPLIRPRPARVRRRCPGDISLVRPRRRTRTASPPNTSASTSTRPLGTTGRSSQWPCSSPCLHTCIMTNTSLRLSCRGALRSGTGAGGLWQFHHHEHSAVRLETNCCNLTDRASSVRLRRRSWVHS